MSDKKPAISSKDDVKKILDPIFSMEDCGDYFILDNAIHVRFRTVQDEPKGSGIHVLPLTKADVLDAVNRGLDKCFESVYFYLPATSEKPFDQALTEKIFHALSDNPMQIKSLRSWAGREMMPPSRTAISTLSDHCDRIKDILGHLYKYDQKSVDWARIIWAFYSGSSKLNATTPDPVAKPIAAAWREQA